MLQHRVFIASFAIVIALTYQTISCFASEASQPPSVHVIKVQGAIGVGTGTMIQEALANADDQTVALLVIEVDTPGGLVQATRDIIKLILASRIPVAVYVSPNGARAASAGTYIAYAAHLVGMAPGTHLGAATPVQMTLPGLPRQPQAPQPAPADKSKPGDGKSAMERKVLNDAVAYLRSLAQLRGRSEKWADKFVRDASTLTAQEALKEQIVDVVADDIPSFLRQIDGRVVKTAAGAVRLDIDGASIKRVEPSWKVQFLTAITDPNIAFILLLVGIYGIIFEFWSPGLTGPGVIGGISLLLALFSLSALPLSYAGLALLLLGVVLMIAEALAPGLGILGIGGVVAFILGAIFLFDPAGSDLNIAIYTPLIAAMAITSALLFIGLFGFLMRSRRAKISAGAEEMIGADAEVLSWQDGEGRVRVHGEVWAARATHELVPGNTVKVVKREGLTLSVE